MELNPYLMFNGNCEEAFLFYQQLLGGDLERVRFRDLPGAAPTEPGWDGKLAHAALKVAGRTLMASDAPPPYQQPLQGFSLSLWVEDAAECDRIFNALAEGGSVTMPLAETDWSDRFGMCSDRFGVGWMVGLPNRS